MKKKIVFILTLLVALTLCSCQNAFVEEYVYEPAGKFYAKTRPVRGDGGNSHVISLEAQYASYEGEGDITVTFTVGFGHEYKGKSADKSSKETFYVHYQVYGLPRDDDEAPAWEKKVEYSEYWDDPKFNTTERVDRSFLFIPFYGDFYPFYREPVDIVFPEGLESGRLEITIPIFQEGETEHPYSTDTLLIDFERVDGVLTLEPSN